jgi:hypothetical protein
MSHLDECARLAYVGARERDINPETNDEHHRIVGCSASAMRTRRVTLSWSATKTRQGILGALVATGQGVA